MSLITSIKTIGNYYGILNVKKKNNLFYWSIEDLDGYDWYEIPEYLYNALIKYEEERKKELNDD